MSIIICEFGLNPPFRFNTVRMANVDNNIMATFRIHGWAHCFDPLSFLKESHVANDDIATLILPEAGVVN